jgi:DNA-binding transcriptional regulator YbjK
VTTREEQIADAALTVLAAEGARGLTHRAADRAAGLPEGSASNCFRSREALLAAALARHAELDVPPAASGSARDLVLAALDHLLAPARRHLLAARYELFLESTRRPALHVATSEARGRFVGFAAAVLPDAARAPQLVAVLDGILLDQLLGADSALDRAGIEALVDRVLG